MNYSELLIFMKIIPTIAEAIKAVESAVPGEGKGKEKLEAVVSLLITANDALKLFVPQITAIIGILVKLFNLTGSWSKATS